MLDKHLDGIVGHTWSNCSKQAIARTVGPGELVVDADRGFDSLDLVCLEVEAGGVIDASVSIRHARNLIGGSAKSPDGRRQKHSNWDSQALAQPEIASYSHQLPHLSASGKARQVFYRLLDGERTLGQVQNLMEGEASGLFATRSELERFVRSEWARSRA